MSTVNAIKDFLIQTVALFLGTCALALAGLLILCVGAALSEWVGEWAAAVYVMFLVCAMAVAAARVLDSF